MEYATEEQKFVVEARMKEGYEILGTVASKVNDVRAFVVVKGKHTMVINSLGYDEYTGGPVFGIREC